MIGGNDYLAIPLGELPQHFEHMGMLKPGAHQGTEGGLVGGHLLQNFRFRAAVHKNIDEVVDNRYERRRGIALYFLGQVLTFIEIEHLDILGLAF